MFYAKKLTNFNLLESEDLVQDTFLKAIDKKEYYKPDKADMKKWLLSILHNIYIDNKRKCIIENKMYSTSIYKVGGDTGSNENDGTLNEKEEISLYEETYNPLEVLENRELNEKIRYFKKNLRKYIKNEDMYIVVKARLMGLKFLDIEKMFGIKFQSGKTFYFRFKDICTTKMRKEIETYI